MRKIFVTAGHRGGNTGANGIFKEAEETIRMRNEVINILKGKGINAVRDQDTDGLNIVVSSINKQCDPNDICVDFHFNAFNGKANGTEVVTQNYPTNTEIDLAEDMLNATIVELGTKNRGIKKEGQSQHRTLAMLSGVKCNSVLVEICFCDNEEDAQKYNDNFEALAFAYAEVLERYAKS